MELKTNKPSYPLYSGDIDDEYSSALLNHIILAAHHASRDWTRAAVLINQVVSEDKGLVGAMFCPFIVGDGQRFLGKWMSDDQSKEITRIVETWQHRIGKSGYTNWSAIFVGVEKSDNSQYKRIWIPEYRSDYGKWHIADSDEVNWWAFHEGFSDKPAF